MNIVQEGQYFLKSVSQQFPKKLHIMIEFGFKTLSISRIKSLNSNARSLVENRNTAESKIYRLTSNKNLVYILPKLVVHFVEIKKGAFINIDFSDFNGFMVLMFALQTKKGRAIPLYFNIIQYPIKKGSQNLFIKECIKDFLNIINNKQVTFVMDRGFACPHLLGFLCNIKQYFVVRVKRIKHVRLKNGKKKKVEDMHFKDMDIYAYENNLRVVRSDKTKGCKENWYLITNNFKIKYKKIIKTYYYRFEIEELFKDNKHLHGLEFIRIKKTQSMKIVLYFVMIGIWFFNYLEKESSQGEINIKKIRGKKRELSYLYYWFEQLRRITKIDFLNSLRI